MKKLLFALFFFSGLKGFAQYPSDSLIGGPSGYTAVQLRGVNGLVIDSSDNKWIAFRQIGLGKLDSLGWTMYDTSNSPLPTNNILSLACNASGVWAGTKYGLYNFDGTTWKWYNTSNSAIPFDSIPNLYSSGGNKLWIFSRQGFIYFDGSSFTEYNTSNSGLVNDTVQCIFQSSTGTWWIGTINGLSSFDGTAWQSYTESNTMMCDDNIYSIIEDKNQSLIISGLYIKSGTNFYAIADYYTAYYPQAGPIVNPFHLSDGRILIASFSESQLIISTNPIKVDVSAGGNYSSTDILNMEYAIDKMDRIWKVRKLLPGISLVILSDSITFNNYAPYAPKLSSYNDLNINQVRCGMWNDNTFHWDKWSSSLYSTPKYCGRNPLYASALWIGGLDSSGKIHMSAHTYRQSGTDFWPGPLDTVTAKIDSATVVRYDSIWKVNRDSINQFIIQYDLGNVTSGIYKVPREILNWPAHGIGSYSRNLAPFKDRNGDGTYNPYDGDFPDMKGDQMLWWMMNDNFNQHTETNGGIPFGMEIHSKAYAYSCPNVAINDEAVNYTTFYSFDFINRSDTDYHNVYLGIWVDVDLGNYNDDYIGCRIDGDYGFVYNGDNNDEGSLGYGVNPPMLSVAVLKGPKADPNDGLDNNHNGTIDELDENCMMNGFRSLYKDATLCGSPYVSYDFYYFLKNLWLGGLYHITYGGSGCGSSGCGATNIPTSYMYSGMPYDTGWTEVNACNPPFDRRFLLSSGPFSLRKNESKTLDYAFVFTWDKTHSNGTTTSVAKNHNDVMKVKHWFDTDSFPCSHLIGVQEVTPSKGFALIYPNPATSTFILQLNAPLTNFEVIIYDMLGKEMLRKKLSGESMEIERGSLESGVYFVRVRSEERQWVEKVVVQ